MGVFDTALMADAATQSGRTGASENGYSLIDSGFSGSLRMGSGGRMRLFGLVFAVVAAVVVGAGARCQTARAGESPLKVVVTVAPLKGLVEPLLPEGSSVTVLMQPGKSEHGYEFTPADMAAVAKADVFVYVGLGLEGRLERTVNQMRGHRVVCFADAVGIEAAAKDPHGEKEHAPEHAKDDHDHEHAVDPHLWLDPSLSEKLVDAVAKAVFEAQVAKRDPKSTGLEAQEVESKRVLAAASALKEQVRAVDAEWKQRLAPLKGRAVVTHHNAFSRPAERYGFRVAAVIREFETSEPSPGDIAKVVEAVRKEHVKTIFVEPQFSSAAADRIAERAGVKVGHLDPLGDGDWFEMMKSNLDALVSGLSDDPKPAPANDKPVTPGAK
jgi:zinc transport system substrate-binding protein